MTSPTDIMYWPPHSAKDFDWSKPTFEAYGDSSDDVTQTHMFTNPFRESRSKLDYSYHKNPVLNRQKFQDAVLSRVLNAVSNDELSSTPQHQIDKQHQWQQKSPFIVFTSGPMGVGKSYVLTQLNKRHILPLHKWIKIDPDKFKSELPEMAGYLEHDSESAATKLHRESTQMSDVLFEHALTLSHNILVDGSLKDVDWYTKLFRRLKHEFPHYKLVILYVSASPQTIQARAKARAEKTGRVVPPEKLQESIEQVPRSVQALSHLTDLTVEITNDDNQPMKLMRWSSSTSSVGSDDVDKSENTNGAMIERSSMQFKELRRVWNPSCTHQECCEKIVCHLTKHLACPIQSVSEYKAAKDIWGNAYPSFCPESTMHD